MGRMTEEYVAVWAFVGTGVKKTQLFISLCRWLQGKLKVTQGLFNQI